MGLKRIDKLIALNCNVSRKDARNLIKDGAVTVNSRVCLRAEELVDAEVDDISVKGYNFTAKELQVPIFRNGELVYQLPTLEEIRAYSAQDPRAYIGETAEIVLRMLIV
jgi:ribosomal protein S4